MNTQQLIIANWKMALGFAESRALARGYADFWKASLLKSRLDLVICPTAIAVSAVGEDLRDSGIALGAQDVFWQASGAYTGETSANSLKEIGCSYVILGHSEHRRYAGETDETVNRKVKAALEAKLTPVMCVGETFDDRQEGRADYVVMRQVIEGLRGARIGADDMVVVAYEPVWVIGTGQAIEPHMVDHASNVMHQVLLDLFPPETVSSRIRMLYGGSVDEYNIAEYAHLPRLSGVLVGGTSIHREHFIKLIEHVAR